MPSRSKTDNQKKYSFNNENLIELVDKDGKPFYVDLNKLQRQQQNPPDPKIPRLSKSDTEPASESFPDQFHSGATYCFDGFHSNQNNRASTDRKTYYCHYYIWGGIPSALW